MNADHFTQVRQEVSDAVEGWIAGDVNPAVNVSSSLTIGEASKSWGLTLMILVAIVALAEDEGVHAVFLAEDRATLPVMTRHSMKMAVYAATCAKDMGILAAADAITERQSVEVNRATAVILRAGLKRVVLDAIELGPPLVVDVGRDLLDSTEPVPGTTIEEILAIGPKIKDHFDRRL